MREIATTGLSPNTYYDQPVYLDEGFILLTQDTPLTAELIERLHRWDFPAVRTGGRELDSPVPPGSEEGNVSTSNLDRDVKDKNRREQAARFYFTMLTYVTDRFKKFSASNKLDLGEITDRIKEIIHMLKDGRELLLRLNEYGQPADNYLPAHSLNSTLLALTIGEQLKLTAHRMIELGLASLLHDIGMIKIPETLYLNPNALTPQELKMVRAHTILGYKILKGFSLPESVALPALEHHERLDGSGYPQALSGERISLYSRVVGITCPYDAMISPRPFKRSLSGHQALLELLKGNRTQYDDRVLRALIYILSVYPLGSLVLLSNGLRARVARTNPDNPRFPVVQLLADASGRRLAEQVFIQTAGEDGVAIRRDLTGDESAGLG